jgi:hypothetical protein
MTQSPADTQVAASLTAGHPPAAATSPASHGHHQSFWLWVMCLTGVDYFSTLGYQPSLAFESAGSLAPLATGVLVLATLFGALPIYCYVAARSPHGQGSIHMLEELVHGWTGKFFVLVLLGFAATDFVITKTLSAADAAEHIIHNPKWQDFAPWMQGLGDHQQRLLITMGLLVLLGAFFMRGFKEVIWTAVVIVGIFLALNMLVVGSGLVYLLAHPVRFDGWWSDVVTGNWHLPHEPILAGHDFWAIVALSILYFPKLALGLSGFETGVAVMPLIRGEPGDDPALPAGRIRNARKLLVTAALIMSAFLLGSALVTATLIPPETLVHEGLAEHRALAYLAHGQSPFMLNPLFGEIFGTIYDVSTVFILAFAGASAMAGLLNLVPQYLPRYGMAPGWARAARPLVLLFTLINLIVTWIFNADVSLQGGAYATGVLVLIVSACVATVIDTWRHRTGAWFRRVAWPYLAITALFVYTMLTNMFERPDGIKIASCFIVAIIASSLLSRVQRSKEHRFQGFTFADPESRFLWDSLKHLEFPVLVPHRPGRRELEDKESSIRERHRLSPEVPIVFVEVELGDTSEFEQHPVLSIENVGERFVIRVTGAVSIAHVVASVACELSAAGKPPEIHFGWSDESPLSASFSFLLFGEGNVPWIVRELICKAIPDPARQPRVIVG